MTPNLQFVDKGKVIAEFTGVEFQGGTIWVADHVNLIKGDPIYHYPTQTISTYQKGDMHFAKIIAQSPSLNLESIPVVRVEKTDFDIALDRLKMADQSLMDYNPNWSTDDKLKSVLNLISTAYSAIKAAQSKGSFTEKQARLIFNEGFALGNAQIEESDGNEEFYDSDFKRILASIQPKIVVDTYVPEVDKNYYYYEDRHQNQVFDNDSYLKALTRKPITFKGEDGRTYLKQI